MQYLEETTIQSLIYLLFSSTNEFDLSPTGYEDRKSLFSTIYDNDLGDCFFFTLSNNDEAKLIIDDKKLVQDIKRARDSDDTIAALFKNVVRLKKQPVIFQDIIKPNNKLFYELFFVSTMYMLNIVSSKRKKVLNYLRKYIENFRFNSLISEANYYDFERNMNRTSEIFNNLYNKFGSRFNINRMMEIDFKKIPLEKELRLYEVILYLQKKNYIKINNCNFIKSNEKSIMNIDLTFNIPPAVIYNTEKHQIQFKNLSLNEISGEAHFGSNTYTFKTYSREFNLLLNLIKAPSKKINIYQLFDLIAKDESLKMVSGKNKDIKDRMKQYIKEIKNKLGMTKNNKTIDINITQRDFIILR